MLVLIRLLRKTIKLRYSYLRYWRIGLFLIFLVIAGSFLIVFFEKEHNEQFNSWTDGFWWSLVTITTVGYGDKYPVTVAGRITAFFIMLGGIGSFGYLAGTFLEGLIHREKGRLQVKWKNHYVICGFSFKTKNVVEELFATQPDIKIVLLADLDGHPLLDFPEVKFVKGDITDENCLNKANTACASNVIILAESSIPEQSADARSVLTTLAVRHMNPNCWISAETLHPKNEHHLRWAGANEIICTGEISSRLLVQSNIRQYAVEFLRELLTSKRGNEVYEAPLIPEFFEQTFQQVLQKFCRQQGILLGIARKGKLFINPDPDLRLTKGDTLIYLAEEKIL